VTKVIEEEWSYIPVGGPLPLACQPVTAFGAAANLVHPATGYSVSRSLREAPGLAKDIASILAQQFSVGVTAEAVWEALWPQEKRRQASTAAMHQYNNVSLHGDTVVTYIATVA
jgi:lycopene epsilon-cyclase